MNKNAQSRKEEINKPYHSFNHIYSIAQYDLFVKYKWGVAP